jgi:hypothetical protein
VPVLKGGGDEAIVQQAVQLLRADEQLSQLEPLLAFFASFVFSTRLVQQIMRWDKPKVIGIYPVGEGLCDRAACQDS